MAMSRYTRHKLRAHDNGIDRHNKGVAFEKKRARLAAEHHKVVSERKPRATRVPLLHILTGIPVDEMQGVVRKPKQRRR